MGALAQAVSWGKALYVGLSNYDGPTLQQAEGILRTLGCPFVINQNRYSLFDRTVEQNGLKEQSYRLGKGIIAFSPLAQGMLSNRYLEGIPEDSRIRRDGRFLKEGALTTERLHQIRQLAQLAQDRGQSLSQMALAWVLRDEAVTSVLVGASKPQQLVENVAALERRTFTATELQAIDAVLKPM